MKKIVWLLLASLLLLPATTQAAPKLTWQAEYYSNNALDGYPALILNQSTLDFNWGTGPAHPGLPADNFSARWTGSRHFDEGSYLLMLSVDDGARVWIDGKLVIDAWSLGYHDQLKTKLYLEESRVYEIQIAYFDFAGPARLHFDWLKLGSADVVASAWQAEYFSNPTLSGTPDLVRYDPAVEYNWNGGNASDLVTRDNFSVRWTRSIYLREGWYELQLQHDDGLRVYVDGKIIYDAWYDQAPTYVVRPVYLYEGHRNFVVEYYDHAGNATARMRIAGGPGNYDQYEMPIGEVGVSVDESAAGFLWHGPIQNRYVSNTGFNGLHYWTYNYNQPLNSGRWSAPIGGAGNYEVYAYIPAENSTTTAATYQIVHHGELMERVIDQSQYSDTWVSLGQYYFNGTSPEYVILSDLTLEAPATTRIAFDALKFVQR